MELYMLRVSIREEERTIIARFLSSLSIEFRDKVELFPYRDLNDLVQLCIKVKQQIRRKFSLKKELSYSSHYKKDLKKECYSFKSYPKSEPSKERRDKGKSFLEKETTNTSYRTSSIKCFKCLERYHIASQCSTKKTMILRGKDHYSSKNETTSSSTFNDSEKKGGKALVERKLIHVMALQKKLHLATTKIGR
uniref:CCHC-type domain-containing protein n=1 Tax=Cajanus cajan TaxID=3821 RepID=A0A151QUS3_CAJCA|nr:hypothetical protein KK1_045068 [Cajanus cajan]